MTLTLGQTASLRGDVGRLNATGARSPSAIEASLGFNAGRLSKGYYIALLKEPLRPNHVLFGGLTLRSGGRAGLPLADPIEDRMRRHNHEGMIDDYGAKGVAAMLDKLAADPRNLSGGERIVKIVPVTGHIGKNPKEEYPPGGGGAQYTLTSCHSFLIAVHVNASAIATTAALWSASVADDAPYDDRHRLLGYLRSA